MAAAEYRIIAPGGAEAESGSAEAMVTDGALDIQPVSRASLHIPFGRVVSISEPQPYTVAVRLDDGHVIELSRMGVMRTQLLAEMRDARAGVTAADAGAVGRAEVFPGWVGDSAVEVHVHEDALLVIADGWTRRVGFSFLGRVTVENYAVEVALSDGTSVLISRLRESRGRTAVFLGSLLPGLDPMSARAVAGLARDGVAVPTHSLDAIHPEVTSTLLQVATRPDRFAAVAALAQHTDLAIGFKQAASVRVAASGGSPWQPADHRTHIQEHEAPEGIFRPGLAGMLARDLAGPGFGLGLGGLGYGGPFGGGPDGGLDAYWAYQALGAGINWSTNAAGPPRQMTPRPGVQRGTLTPPREDLAALTTSGSEPTVLAFALFASSRGRVAYEVLNLPEPVTYVYEADGDARSVINRALDDTGFQAAAVHAAADGGLMAAVRTDAPAVLLASSLIARIPHGQDWQRQLAGLLS